MGLGESSDGTTSRAFARDVLSIEICGPDRPQLTLVDLPGLIHSENKSQSNSDVQLIRGLVGEYISNERTIILPIISAKNDYANQIILQHCRKADPKGARTLGIVTKPDFLKAGSENEQSWLDLISNRDIVFELGWHALRNRTDDEMTATFAERNSTEKVYFSQGKWKTLEKGNVGVERLRGRLSSLLEKHLKKELPGLKKELEAKAAETADQLDQLSEKRSTLLEQRQFLMRMSMNIHEIIKAGVNGYYDHHFFGQVDIQAAVDAPTNAQRLRATIHHLNIRFASTLRTSGHKYAIMAKPKPEEQSHKVFADDDSDDADLQSELQDIGQALSDTKGLSKKVSRQKAIAWVLCVLQRTRGRELPGTFNPLVIAQLFKEQSATWKSIAESHIDETASQCADFIKQILAASAPTEVRDHLWDLKVEQALQTSLDASRHELRKILDDKERHPITYNHYFTTTVQKMRQQKYTGEMRNLTKGALRTVHEKNNMPGPGYDSKEYICPSTLESKMNTFIEQDMDKFAAEQVLDELIAFYKDELKYFIGAITKQVIERHLVDPLPSQILSPVIVAGFSDEEVAFLASESAEVTQRRETLEGMRDALAEGRGRLKGMMGLGVGKVGKVGE